MWIRQRVGLLSQEKIVLSGYRVDGLSDRFIVLSRYLKLAYRELIRVLYLRNCWMSVKQAILVISDMIVFSEFLNNFLS